MSNCSQVISVEVVKISSIFIFSFLSENIVVNIDIHHTRHCNKGCTQICSYFRFWLVGKCVCDQRSECWLQIL